MEAMQDDCLHAPGHRLGALEMLCSRNIQFPHKVPLHHMLWCPCLPFQKRSIGLYFYLHALSNIHFHFSMITVINESVLYPVYLM